MIINIHFKLFGDEEHAKNGGSMIQVYSHPVLEKGLVVIHQSILDYVQPEPCGMDLYMLAGTV